MIHYNVTVGILAADNTQPHSRHVFLAQVDADEALRARAAREHSAEGLYVSDREDIIKAAVKDGVCEFLQRRNILVFGLVATADTKRAIVAGAGVPDRQPDFAGDGVRLWYYGQGKAEI